MAQKSDSEWRAALTPQQYKVLRGHGTEPPGSSPLNLEKRDGTFACAGCGEPLFSADAKYESGTGWPSFFKPLEGSVETTTDRSFGMTRVEVHCKSCGGHLGHLFPDGPQPTGMRYCMNGVALAFEPETTSANRERKTP
jgi:peptide-methionine (R)-S-oxide reductase